MNHEFILTKNRRNAEITWKFLPRCGLSTCLPTDYAIGSFWQHVPSPACSEFELAGLDGPRESHGRSEERPALAALLADAALRSKVAGLDRLLSAVHRPVLCETTLTEWSRVRGSHRGSHRSPPQIVAGILRDRRLRAGRWCNGNTADSGSVYRGSNPCLPANSSKPGTYRVPPKAPSRWERNRFLRSAARTARGLSAAR